MSVTTEDSSTTPSVSELREFVPDGSNSLAVVLQNLTTTLSQLSEASQAQTAVFADLKEDIFLQDDAAGPNPDRPADSLDITQITAVVNDCTRDSGANTNASNNMASDTRSDSEPQGHNSIVDCLTQAYLPNTKTSPAIEGKIATLVDNMLTGGLSTDTVKESADKYSPPENVSRLNVTSVNEEVWDLLPRRSRTVDLAFQRLQEFLLPGLSALCTLSGKLVSSIQSGDTPNTRETLTVIMDSIALLCNTHHKLNMKRRELIKPELNPPYTQLCEEEIKTTSKLFGDDLSIHLKDMAELKKAGIQMQKPSSTSTSSQGYKAPKQRFNRPHFAKPYARAHGQFTTQKANSQRHFLANSRAPRGAHTKQHTPIRKDQ